MNSSTVFLTIFCTIALAVVGVFIDTNYNAVVDVQCAPLALQPELTGCKEVKTGRITGLSSSKLVSIQPTR